MGKATCEIHGLAAYEREGRSAEGTDDAANGILKTV